MSVQLEITTENLLNAVAQMPENEFDLFVEQAKQLRTRRTENKFSQRETDLIYKINTIFTSEKRLRYIELYDKFKEEKINSTEQAELLKLSDEFEILNAKRLEYLGELAKMRGQTIKEIIKDLGIKP